MSSYTVCTQGWSRFRFSRGYARQGENTDARGKAQVPAHSREDGGGHVARAFGVVKSEEIFPLFRATPVLPLGSSHRETNHFAHSRTRVDG